MKELWGVGAVGSFLEISWLVVGLLAKGRGMTIKMTFNFSMAKVLDTILLIRC